MTTALFGGAPLPALERKGQALRDTGFVRIAKYLRSYP